MIVISDTSPISNLFIIGRLDLLMQLYGNIVIPQAVMTELLALERRGIDLTIIKTAQWIEVRAVEQRENVNKLLQDIDLGEAEAIVLADHLYADWLLMDEAKGRVIARQHGLRIVGLLGMLLAAKEKNLLISVKQILEELIYKAKFRVSEELYQKVLEAAGEL